MIAVVGLGAVGLGIARRFYACGYRVVGVDSAEARRTAWTSLTGEEAFERTDGVPWSSCDHAIVAVRTTDQALDVINYLENSEVTLTCIVVTTLEQDAALALGSHSTV